MGLVKSSYLSAHYGDYEMITETKGKLGFGSSIPPELINRVFYNSAFGMFKRVGAPTFAELQERRLHIAKLRKILNYL